MKKLLLMTAALLLSLSLCLSAAGETVTLSFVGDCTTGEQWCFRNYKSGYCYKIRKAGFDYPFSLCAYLFAQDDLTLANCEVCLTNVSPHDKTKAMSLSGAPEFAQVFQLGYVDAVNVINNHSDDFGTRGKQDTIAALEQYGIGYFGGTWVYETEVKGIKIGVCGQRYHVNDYILEQYKTLFAQLRADGCDFIIASVHWGREDNHNLNAEQKKYATKILDAGADLLYGHGSHTVQPVEYYNGKIIMYSTGNFTFGANAKPKDMDTAVFQVLLDVADDGTITTAALKTYPYCVCDNADFRPYPYTTQEDKERVWQKLVFDGHTYGKSTSNLPESFVTTGYACFMEGYEEAPVVATDTDLPAPSGQSTKVSPAATPAPTVVPHATNKVPSAEPNATLPGAHR